MERNNICSLTHCFDGFFFSFFLIWICTTVLPLLYDIFWSNLIEPESTERQHTLQRTTAPERLLFVRQRSRFLTPAVFVWVMHTQHATVRVCCAPQPLILVSNRASSFMLSVVTVPRLHGHKVYGNRLIEGKGFYKIKTEYYSFILLLWIRTWRGLGSRSMYSPKTQSSAIWKGIIR